MGARVDSVCYPHSARVFHDYLRNTPDMKPDGFGRLVGNVIFVPAGIAYVWETAGWVQAGLGLYLFFIVGAFLTGIFKRFREWPIISKIALAASAILMCLGCYFSTIEITGYYWLLPLFAYYALSMFAWHELGSRFDR